MSRPKLIPNTAQWVFFGGLAAVMLFFLFLKPVGFMLSMLIFPFWLFALLVNLSKQAAKQRQWDLENPPAGSQAMTAAPPLSAPRLSGNRDE